MSRMFSDVARTWNPIVGCRHLCSYCWAMRLANTKLRHLPQYKDGFDKPKLVESTFKKRFMPGELVFVSDMGDMWGDWVPKDWILKVLYYIKKFPETQFLFLTKNPRRYYEFLGVFPENVYLGATIETNRDKLTAEISRAPPPSERYIAMRDLDWKKKVVSIEPVLDFDIDVFARWMYDINPIKVYIGYDNYRNRLKEPVLMKTKRFIYILRKNGINVSIKTIRKAWYE